MKCVSIKQFKNAAEMVNNFKPPLVFQSVLSRAGYNSFQAYYLVFHHLSGPPPLHGLLWFCSSRVGASIHSLHMYTQIITINMFGSECEVWQSGATCAVCQFFEVQIWIFVRIIIWKLCGDLGCGFAQYSFRTDPNPDPAFKKNRSQTGSYGSDAA